MLVNYEIFDYSSLSIGENDTAIIIVTKSTRIEYMIGLMEINIFMTNNPKLLARDSLSWHC